MTCLPERNLVKSPTSAEKAAASAKAQPLIDWRAATSAAIGLASTAALYSESRSARASAAASTSFLRAASVRTPPSSSGLTLSSHLRKS